jgi:hypothetical protein
MKAAKRVIRGKRGSIYSPDLKKTDERIITSEKVITRKKRFFCILPVVTTKYDVITESNADKTNSTHDPTGTRNRLDTRLSIRTAWMKTPGVTDETGVGRRSYSPFNVYPIRTYLFLKKSLEYLLSALPDRAELKTSIKEISSNCILLFPYLRRISPFLRGISVPSICISPFLAFILSSLTKAETTNWGMTKSSRPKKSGVCG